MIGSRACVATQPDTFIKLCEKEHHMYEGSDRDLSYVDILNKFQCVIQFWQIFAEYRSFVIVGNLI